MLDLLGNAEKSLLTAVSGIDAFASDEAYNLRLNGRSVAKNVTENIKIVPKSDVPGIDVYVKDNTKGEQLHIPVIISESGVKETVFNDFHIGKNCDIVIIAGCGIHNCGKEESEHSGIHSFYVGEGSKIRYNEKHLGTGDSGSRIMNPTTYIELAEASYMEMDTVQIGGIDDTSRKTTALLGKAATLVVKEKILTENSQNAKTEFTVDLNGESSGCHVVSRSVAKNRSTQLFISNIRGNSKCSGHTECDAIVMDDARVSAIPEISANNVDAALIHEAAIGKIAGEQIIKLMTLGLTEKEAEEQIINGFMK